MHRLPRALSAWALVAACAPERVAPRPRTAPLVHAPPRARAVLSLHFDKRRPAWFLGEDVPVVPDVDVAAELVRENVDSDILKLGGRYYAYDEKHGASGPFAPPGGADWLGIDRGGAVWVARRDGAILRAPDVDAALHASGFQRVASEPELLDFDVNGFHAVGAAGRELVVIDSPKPPKVCGGSHRTRAPRVKMGETFGSGEACAGAAFVMGAIHPARDSARYHFGLLSDASCPQSDASWECAPGKPLTRRPHAGVIDRDENRLRIAALPRDCDPVRMLSAGGVGMLLCKSSDGVRVEMLDRSGTWYREADLAGVDARRTTLEMARDGTVLLRSRWVDFDKRAAWVRRPVALGRADAWRRIDMSDLLELRAVPDGGVLGIKLAGGAIIPETFSVVLVSPGGRRTLARRVTIDGSLDDFGLVGSKVALWVSNGLDVGPCGCEPMPGMPSSAPLFVLTQAGTLRAARSSKPITARRTCTY